MQRGDAVEVQWTIDDHGIERTVWWPALVWSTSTQSPGNDTVAHLAYARAHGSRAHLAPVRVLSAGRRLLWDPTDKVQLPYRIIDTDAVEFSAADLVHIAQDETNMEDPEDLRQAEQALAAMPEEAKRTLWQGMEDFRRGAVVALEDARAASDANAPVRAAQLNLPCSRRA